MASPSQPLISDSPSTDDANKPPVIVCASKQPNIDGTAYQHHLSLTECGDLSLQHSEMIEQMSLSSADVDAFVQLLASIVRRILVSGPSASSPE
jgi:hypothetical protein